MEQDVGSPHALSQPSQFDADLFIDHVYNAAYDIFEDSFETLEEYVPLVLGNPTEDVMKATTKGFDAVFNTLQEKFEKNLNRWEDYSRVNCFLSGDDHPKIEEEREEIDHMESASQEDQLDAELESVRSELHAAGKESAKIRRELRNLERFFAMKKKHEEALQDAVVQLKDEDHEDMFEELVRVAKALKEKLTKVKPERMQSPRGVRWTGSVGPDLELQSLESVVKALNL